MFGCAIVGAISNKRSQAMEVSKEVIWHALVLFDLIAIGWIAALFMVVGILYTFGAIN